MFGEIVLKTAELSIPRSKGKMNRKSVPWWTEKCSRIMVKIFAVIHNSDILTKESKQGREETSQTNPGIIQRRESTSGVIDAPFT